MSGVMRFDQYEKLKNDSCKSAKIKDIVISSRERDQIKMPIVPATI